MSSSDGILRYFGFHEEEISEIAPNFYPYLLTLKCVWSWTEISSFLGSGCLHLHQRSLLHFWENLAMAFDAPLSEPVRYSRLTLLFRSFLFGFFFPLDLRWQTSIAFLSRPLTSSILSNLCSYALFCSLHRYSAPLFFSVRSLRYSFCTMTEEHLGRLEINKNIASCFLSREIELDLPIFFVKMNKSLFKLKNK